MSDITKLDWFSWDTNIHMRFKFSMHTKSHGIKIKKCIIFVIFHVHIMQHENEHHVLLSHLIPFKWKAFVCMPLLSYIQQQTDNIIIFFFVIIIMMIIIYHLKTNATISSYIKKNLVRAPSQVIYFHCFMTVFCLIWGRSVSFLLWKWKKKKTKN